MQLLNKLQEFGLQISFRINSDSNRWAETLLRILVIYVFTFQAPLTPKASGSQRFQSYSVYRTYRIPAYILYTES